MKLHKCLILFFLTNFLISQNIIWEIDFDFIKSNSSPRSIDLNSDGIEDIVLGGGVDGVPSPFGAMAINGANGEVLWTKENGNEWFLSAQSYDQNDPSSIKDHISAATALGSELGKVMISVEAYPELKSNETMIQAQLTYNETEAKIAAARRFYNSAVSQLNNSIEIFPGSILAKYANAQIMPFYEADEASKQPISAEKFL